MKKKFSSLAVVMCMVAGLFCMTGAVAGAESSIEINASNFPDSNFRAYVSEQFDTNRDGSLEEAEISAVTEIVRPVADTAAPSDLQGVAYFTALTTLDCSNCTDLATLNVSGLANLKIIILTNQNGCNDCDNLSTLNASGCTSLAKLDCSDSDRLRTLNLSGCTELSSLEAWGCAELSEIDLSGCTGLKNLQCYGGEALRVLSVNECTNLEKLNCSGTGLTALDVSNLTSLKTLTVSGSGYDCKALATMDASGCTSLQILDCLGCEKLTTLNVSGCSSLKYLTVSDDAFGNSCKKLATLNANGCTSMTSLDVKQCKKLTSLSLRDCTGLRLVNCSTCESLTTLDVGGCTGLRTMEASFCDRLSTLNVSGCSALQTVDCSGCTTLATVNVATCSALKEIYTYEADIYGTETQMNTVYAEGGAPCLDANKALHKYDNGYCKTSYCGYVSTALTGARDIAVHWDRQKSVSGYYVYMRKGSGKYAYYKKTSENALNLRKKSGGSKYCFKVVPYKTIDGKNLWNLTKKMTTVKPAFPLKTVAKSRVDVKKYSSKRVTVRIREHMPKYNYYEISVTTSKNKTASRLCKVKSNGLSKDTTAKIKVKNGVTYYYKVREVYVSKKTNKNIRAPWSAPKAFRLYVP